MIHQTMNAADTISNGDLTIIPFDKTQLIDKLIPSLMDSIVGLTDGGPESQIYDHPTRSSVSADMSMISPKKEAGILNFDKYALYNIF